MVSNLKKVSKAKILSVTFQVPFRHISAINFASCLKQAVFGNMSDTYMAKFTLKLSVLRLESERKWSSYHYGAKEDEACFRLVSLTAL